MITKTKVYCRFNNSDFIVKFNPIKRVALVIYKEKEIGNAEIMFHRGKDKHNIGWGYCYGDLSELNKVKSFVEVEMFRLHLLLK